MKKIIIFLLVILSSINSFADTQIQMEKYNGVYRIPCSVNGAKMKFIFDTGASNVCLSLPMAEYLYDNDFISLDDIKGSGTSEVADGRIVDHVVINIRDIEIAGNHIYNVRAVVIDGQNAPLLMGQSAIQKIGPITINGDKLTIHNESNNSESLSHEQLDKMYDEAMELYKKGAYFAAKDIFQTLFDYDLLADIGLIALSDCCFYSDDINSAISYINKVEDIDDLISNGIDFYNKRGMLYLFSGNDEKAISDFERGEMSKIYGYDKAYIYKLWALALFDLKKYKKAGEKFADAFNFKADELNVDPDLLLRDCNNNLSKKEKSVKDDEADEIIFWVWKCAYFEGRSTKKTFFDKVIDFAACGNKEAQRYCEDRSIDYERMYRLKNY